MPHIRTLILFSIIGTGLSTVPAQLLTIREFLSQFHGNEITISLVLFCWLLLTGVGSLAARFIRRPGLAAYGVLCLILALWPLLQILAVRWLRSAVFLHGTSPGFYGITAYVSAAVAPYCLMAGYILPHALEVLRKEKSPLSSGGLYVTDSIGDILGGALFGFVLVYRLTPFPTIVLTSSVLLISGVVILLVRRCFALAALGLGAGAVFFGAGLVPEFETRSLEPQFQGIVRYVESPYGRIVVTRGADGFTFWESGTPLQSSENRAAVEERIHYPLCQLDSVGEVLLVSGGIGGALEEIRKYGPSGVDYVELDPFLTRTAIEMGVLEGMEGVSIINMDGRRYIQETAKTYDAIILDLSDPDTFQMNRFFTSEFFSIARDRLGVDGILCFALDYYPNYLTDEMRARLSSVYNSVRPHFANILVIPGGRAYFLCRDGPLSRDIPRRLEKKSVTSDYIAGYYRGEATTERFEMIQGALDHESPANTDFQPVIMGLAFLEWFRMHESSPVPFVLVVGGLVLLYLFFMKREEYILFTTGFATMGAEMLVVFGFQVLHGYVYLKIGALVTAFLAGLLPGAALGSRFGKGRRAELASADILIIAALSAFYLWTALQEPAAGPGWFLAYGFVFSFLCGFQFPAATAIIGEDRSPAAGCLAADLAGAAVGTLVVGALLIPLWGLQKAALALVLLKASSLLMIFFAGRSGALGS